MQTQENLAKDNKELRDRLLAIQESTVNEKSEWETFAAYFKVAGISILNHWELPNRYWPQPYVKLRLENPWWLVETPRGNIVIGWRKRVISIDWQHTTIRKVVTADDVTKDTTYVHAWNDIAAITYLKALAEGESMSLSSMD